MNEIDPGPVPDRDDAPTYNTDDLLNTARRLDREGRPIEAATVWAMLDAALSGGAALPDAWARGAGR